jgi:predicted Zn-dependent protease
METIGIATLLAMILAGDKSAESIWGLSTAAQYVNLMRTLEYSQQSEFEADQDAVQLLRRTPYRPVAMLTLLERFARDAERQVGPTIAFIQTHPPSRERVEQVEATLKSLGIATDTAARRAVTKVSVATSEEVTVGDQKLWRVMLNGHEILTVAATDHGSSADRAKQIADAINAALDVGMRPYEVAGAADGSAIIYRGEPIFPLAIQDAALAPGVPSLPDLAAKVAHNLQYAIEKGLIADL